MGHALVTLKVMPESVDTSLEELTAQVHTAIKDFGGDVLKTEQEPVAFGLIALNIIFAIDEKTDTEPLQQTVNDFDTTASADITDIRRAIG